MRAAPPTPTPSRGEGKGSDTPVSRPPVRVPRAQDKREVSERAVSECPPASLGRASRSCSGAHPRCRLRRRLRPGPGRHVILFASDAARWGRRDRTSECQRGAQGLEPHDSVSVKPGMTGLPPSLARPPSATTRCAPGTRPRPVIRTASPATPPSRPMTPPLRPPARPRAAGIKTDNHAISLDDFANAAPVLTPERRAAGVAALGQNGGRDLDDTSASPGHPQGNGRDPRAGQLGDADPRLRADRRSRPPSGGKPGRGLNPGRRAPFGPVRTAAWHRPSPSAACPEARRAPGRRSRCGRRGS